LVLEDWATLVRDHGGSTNVALTRVDSGLIFVPLTMPPRAVADVARFAQLRTLRPMPPIKEPRPVGAGRSEFVAPETVVVEGERIAVFDGGVDVEAPGLAGYVVDHDLTGGTPALRTFVEHGTAVCSAALYGHLEAGEAPVPPHTGVDHFRVWPPPATERADADLMWVLKQIEMVLARGEHRIAVISLGPAFNIADEEPHPWTTVLDQIAADYGVLMVVAAGNTGDLAPGLDRLLVPADAVNGLSVGGCTALTGDVVRADYSSVGPGRAGGRTAPMGVQFGGDLDAAPFGALLSDGTVGEFEGTSMAAPVVARAAAELILAVEQKPSAELLRTMLVHFAERVPLGRSDERGSTPSEVGYGRFPRTFGSLLDHRPGQVTILFEGTLRRAEQVAVPFPLPPEAFAEEPTRLFKLRWTLGFLGPVEPANAVDYSCAGLGVFFRPDADVYNLYPPDGPEGAEIPVNRRTEPARYAMLLEQGWTPSRRPKPATKTGYAPEVVRRAQDGRWETTVRMDRQMKGASLHEPCLDMHMLGREAGTLTDIPDLSWALVLTVEAPTGCSLYDETRAHATQLTPLTTTVPIISSVNA
ncbi:MAG TPA: S8 family serine peptidase, partial [Micromonospora sp.]